MRIDDDWNHYAYTYGEPPRTAQVRFDVGCALQPAPASHALCVRLRQEGGEGGFEDALRRELADVDCWLVGVLAYHGGTTWVLQVEDRAGLATARPRLEAAATGPLTWQETPGWDFFDDQVCPKERDWQQISDREQLERLASQGMDLAADHAVSHAFFGPEEALQRLVEQLAPEGFTVASSGDRRLVLVAEHPPAQIFKRTVVLARLARQAGALYDGWTL